MTMRTPLGKVRGLGSARSGTTEFWRQRVTALALVPLTVIFVLIVIRLVGASHATAVSTLGSPLVGILMLLFVLTGVVHMRIGMKVIIEDYVENEELRLLALIANTFFAVVVGATSVYALLKLSFGV